jgi:hypothetical protein
MSKYHKVLGFFEKKDSVNDINFFIMMSGVVEDIISANADKLENPIVYEYLRDNFCNRFYQGSKIRNIITDSEFIDKEKASYCLHFLNSIYIDAIRKYNKELKNSTKQNKTFDDVSYKEDFEYSGKNVEDVLNTLIKKYKLTLNGVGQRNLNLLIRFSGGEKVREIADSLDLPTPTVSAAIRKIRIFLSNNIPEFEAFKGAFENNKDLTR